MPGIFITLEGGEGSGKTTIINAIDNHFKGMGYNTVTTREPGGVDIAEQIRSVILNVNNTKMCSETEALLYAAARMQHLHEKVIPALLRGDVVICDRYIDSSLVYQGIARGLGIDDVLKANCFALNYMPNLTFFIDVRPEVGLKRIEGRDKIDRLDKEAFSFHQNVYNGYKKIASMYKDRIITIDGERPSELVVKDIIKHIDLYLNSRR